MNNVVRQLKERGFDRSRASGFNSAHVACSQCEALVINGIACHETGCPNARRPQKDLDEC